MEWNSDEICQENYAWIYLGNKICFAPPPFSAGRPFFLALLLRSLARSAMLSSTLVCERESLSLLCTQPSGIVIKRLFD